MRGDAIQKCFANRSTIRRPMLSEAVAAGLGALSTFTMRLFSTIEKSMRFSRNGVGITGNEPVRVTTAPLYYSLGICSLFVEPAAQGFQRTMQIDLQRSFAAVRNGGGVPERLLLQDQGLHGFALALRQGRERLLHHGHVLKCGPRSWRTKLEVPGQ